MSRPKSKPSTLRETLTRNARKRGRGKTKTERIDDALIRALETDGGDEVDRLLAGLNADEQTLFHELLESIRGAQNAGIDLTSLWKVDYTQRPPTAEEFITEPYWLGEALTPKEGNEDGKQGLWPLWRGVLTNDFDLDSRIHNVVITGSIGGGKCSPAGTQVIMHDSTLKTVETIVPGDRLMGDSSGYRTVQEIFTGSGNIFEIIPARGDPFRVSEDHILCLKTSTSDTVVELPVRDYLLLPRLEQARYRVYRTGVDWPEQDVPIDPYWLGLWLGDGTACRVDITTMDSEIRDYFCQYGVDRGCTISTRSAGKGAKACVYSLRCGRPINKKTANPLTQKLNIFGMCNPDPYNPGEKHIPQVYIANSRQVRLSILAGLIDTDGSKKTQEEGGYEITLKSMRMAHQIRFLARSLGYYAETKRKIVSARCYYRTTINGAYDLPVLLERKKSGCRGVNSTGRIGGGADLSDNQKSKFAVESVGHETYYGFSLDGNRRYLFKDFTVTHNSFSMTTIFLYRIALAKLLRNPQNFFGLAPGSKIFYVMLSLSKQVVADTVFGDAQNFMSRSAFFVEECHFNPDMQYTNLRINLGNNLFLSAGSKGWHIIGRNTMGVCLDEGNWRLEANPDIRAYELYDEVRTRIKNRFQVHAGFLPAISLLSSSARDESSFTEKVIAEIVHNNDPAQERIYRFSAYETRRHLLKLQPQWFKVAYGLRNVEPVMLTGWYKETGEPITYDSITTHEEPPPGAKTALVPRDYFEEFKRRVKTSLQSICGVSTGASNRFFSSSVEIERAIELGEASGILNPCTVERIPLSQEDNKEIYDYLTHKTFLTRQHSRILPKRHPDCPRFAHIDLATTSLAGIGICHVVGQQLVEGLIRDGKPFDEYRTVIEYDFILTIQAGQTKPISIEKIQNFFFWLRDYCNYHFALITFDQYQSENSTQMLETRGFTTNKLSLVRTKIPLCAWRTAFDESRIRMYRQNQLVREAEELIDGDKAVEHPQNGSDDTVHGAAGAFFNAHVSGYTGQGPIVSIPVMAGDRDIEEAPANEFKPPVEVREPLVFGG